MNKQKQYRNSSNRYIYRILVSILISMRPKQWSKNLLVFFALLFSIQESWDVQIWSSVESMLINSILAFFVFSIVSGAIYLINDVLDYEKDRVHPSKSIRPVASGRLSKSIAQIATLALLIPAIIAAFIINMNFGWIIVGYVALMISYSMVLKNYVLVDCFAITAGFVLRAIAGATVVDVPISLWLYLCTGLGALVIALAKRRSELTNSGDKAQLQRSNLKSYSLKLIDNVAILTIFATVIAYTAYTFTAPNLPDNKLMTLTIPMVVYGLLRYAYLVHFKSLGESPEDLLLSDKHLFMTVVIWIASTALILILFR